MSGMAALLGAAAGGSGADSDDDYADDFDAPPSPERKTARQVLQPTAATSPIRTVGGGRRPLRAGARGGVGAGGGKTPAAVRGSVAELAKQSEAGRAELMKTSLAAFMKANFVPKKSKRAPPPPKKFTKTRMNDLSKPKQLPSAAFAKVEDKKNCRFKPKISRKSRALIKHNDDPDAFIYRMEAANFSHTNDLERRRAEEAYNARVDKKECPKCHLPQTYAEVEQNQKKCERCNVMYRPKKTWAEVQDTFLKRLEDSQVDKSVKLAQKAKEIERARSKTVKRVYDPESGKTKRVKVKTRSWAQVRADFLKRMEDDASSRKENKERLETEANVDPECTFQPEVTSTFKGDVGSFEERTAADLEKRRAREAKYIEAFVKPPPKKHFSRSQRRIRKAASSLMKGLRNKKHGHAGTAAL